MTESRIKAFRCPGDPPWMLLLLHGYGSNARDMFELARAFSSKCPPGGVFVTLEAQIPTGNPQGKCWFPLRADLTAENWNDVSEAEQDVHNALRFCFDRYGVAPDRTWIGGFSQGAALALQVGLFGPQALGGVLCLSGFFLEPFNPLPRPLRQDAPILWTHGTEDSVVPYRPAHASHGVLKEQGARCTFLPIDGLDHGVDARCMDASILALSRAYGQSS